MKTLISPPLHGTGVRLVTRPDLENVRRLDNACMSMIASMQANGVKVDRALLVSLNGKLTMQMADLNRQITKLTGKEINPGSAEQLSDLLFRHLKLKQNGREKWTRSKARLSADSDVLKAMVSQHPAIRVILDWKEREKIRSTYTLSLVAKLDSDGRLHTDFGTVTAETGRLTCVAPWTILHTSRGCFRFDEYTPVVGDLAYTHKYRWRPILRKIYKGVDSMFRVCLSNGDILNCTGHHRVYTGVCWVVVSELSIGDYLQTYERQQFVHHNQQHQEGGSGIPGSGQAYGRDYSHEDGDNLPQYSVHCEALYSHSRIESRTATALLPQQDGQEQPYVGQEWFPAPQLERQRQIQRGVCNSESCREAPLPTSEGVLGGYRFETNAKGLRGSPHRRRQRQLEPGQLGVMHQESARTASFQTIQVTEITYVGPVPTWDIEVAEDHSYAAGGLFNHNSSDPNLQNIPIRTQLGREVRDAFVPKAGNVIGSCDAGQIEMRQNAHDSQCKGLIDIFKAGRDVYWETAELMYKRQFSAEERANGVVQEGPAKGQNYKAWYRFNAKTTALMTAYDTSPGGLYDQFLMTSPEAWQQDTQEQGEAECAKIIKEYFQVFPEILTRRAEHHKRAFRYMLVWDGLWGRVRWIPQVRSVHHWVVQEGLRAAGNLAGQGGAAGIIKLWMAVLQGLVDSCYRRFGLLMLLQVHDELVVEGPRNVVEDFLWEAAETLRTLFRGVEEHYTVPLDAAWEVGDRWGAFH